MRRSMTEMKKGAAAEAVKELASKMYLSYLRSATARIEEKKVEWPLKEGGNRTRDDDDDDG
jgi:hypothetical protein